jgi:hypothetical protein
MREFVAIYGTPTAAEHLGYFDYALQTGSPTPYKVDLDGFFALLQGDPGFGQLFNVATDTAFRWTGPARTHPARMMLPRAGPAQPGRCANHRYMQTVSHWPRS